MQLAAFALSGSMFAIFLYLTLFMQGFLGLDALEAGVRYLPITVISFLAAPVAGAVVAALAHRVVHTTADPRTLLDVSRASDDVAERRALREQPR